MEPSKLYALKHYGQNFLVNQEIIEQIIKAANITKNDNVIEIGPGLGALSKEIIKCANHLYAFEIDMRFEKPLNKLLKDNNLYSLFITDFLKIDLKDFTDKLDKTKGLIIISNLPYYITSKILIKIFTAQINIRQIVVMMQREVGDKFLMDIPNQDKSILTFLGEYYFEVSEVVSVPFTSFIPPPAVDSVVLSFKNKEIIERVKNEEKFIEVLKELLKMRRKNILNNLKQYLNDSELINRLLHDLNIPVNMRAEDLSLSDFIRITNYLYQ